LLGRNRPDSKKESIELAHWSYSSLLGFIWSAWLSWSYSSWVLSGSPSLWLIACKTSSFVLSILVSQTRQFRHVCFFQRLRFPTSALSLSRGTGSLPPLLSS